MMTKIAVIGCGEWGKNHVRNFAQMQDVELRWCCDKDEKRLAQMKKLYPGIRTTANADDVFGDGEIQAVVIPASAAVHHEFTMKALDAGKHVFVEKPLAVSVRHAEEMAALAAKKKLTLMVGHLLIYHPAVQKLKDMLAKGEMGDVHYVYSQRLNLGKIRQDENALWCFSPHDLSVILHLLEAKPTVVSAVGRSYIQKGIEDVVFINIQFASQQIANIHLSWLDPHKTRKFTIVGSKKMVTFDDMESSDKIKIYDKGANVTGYSPFGQVVALRSGDILIPQIDLSEPLKKECDHFISCVRDGKPCRTSGEDGLKVVRVIAAAEESMRAGGQPVKLG
jgi:predicted dehydrogenase